MKLDVKSKLYLETTVPSYLAANPSRDLIVAAHQAITQEWWERRRRDFAIFISQFVIDEASGGDTEAAARRLALIKNLNQLDVTSAVTDLASAILTSGVIPRSAPTDAAHIAVAAVHGMHFLLTWNCTHIANAEIIGTVEAVCQAHGFQCPIICTPEELLGG